LKEDSALATPEASLAKDTAFSAYETSQRRHYIYPHWPWLAPIRWIRTVFHQGIARPLVWFLANPRVIVPPDLARGVQEPILIVANHITAYDGPLVQYALPGRMRNRIAVAMSGEMLDDFRRFRNPENGRFFLFGPAAYYLVTALFNVFPLPRLRDFQRSFTHAGEALDRGFHVLVFPEGTRSAGKLARFRPGIGLLVKQSDTAVLPVAIRGVGELKARGRRWFRSGAIELRVGEPIRFAPETTEAAITERLHAEVEALLGESR
jgi:long-chain acyl-CoA synthetase